MPRPSRLRAEARACKERGASSRPGASTQTSAKGGAGTSESSGNTRSSCAQAETGSACTDGAG